MQQQADHEAAAQQLGAAPSSGMPSSVSSCASSASSRVRDPRVVPTDGVPNLRDLGGYVSADGRRRVRHGLMYRSAKLTDASASDRARLRARVRLVLDFRDSGEIRRDKAGRVRKEAAEEKEATDMLAVPHRDYAVKTPSPEPDLSRESLGLGESEKAVVRIPIASRPGMGRAVVSRASASEVVKIAFHGAAMQLVSSQRGKFETTISGVVNRLGMLGLNKCILDYCGAEVVSAVRLICDPRNHPVLWHCTHGKDRTALITYFVLSLCGVPLEQIVHDYAVTASYIPGELLDQMPAGYDPVWRQTPAEVMEGTAAYVESKHGGVEKYLEKYGLGRKQQQLFVDSVMEPYEASEQSGGSETGADVDEDDPPSL